MWTVEWLQGSTVMHGASTIVNGSHFRVMDSDYVLQSSGDTDLVRFTWSDGTVQTLVHDNGTSLTWNTSSSQLPHIVWRRGWGHAGCNSGRAGDEDGQDAGPETEECAVCCEALGDMCAWLPCGHVFHDKCIKKWLSEASTCPTCRHSLPSQGQTSGPVCVCRFPGVALVCPSGVSGEGSSVRPCRALARVMPVMFGHELMRASVAPMQQ